MEDWLIALLSVIGVLLLLLVVLPCVGGMIYRACSRDCSSADRMDGMTVIITGASAGIGKETALSIARRGARVIMACRNLRKAQPIADHIVSETGNTKVVVRALDLSDLESVRSFASQINEEEEAVHVLINNAGMITTGPKSKSAQGFELIIATNHYGCFLLTNLLLDKLKASAPSRIVTVASVGYMLNELDVDDLHYEHRSFEGTKAYCQSKLCNVLFTKELARRLQGSGVTANCVHPGYVRSEILRDKNFKGKIARLFVLVLGKDIRAGAQTSVYLAASSEVEGKTGDYYDNCRKTSMYRKANDMDLASKLWDVTCRDVGLTPQGTVA